MDGLPDDGATGVFARVFEGVGVVQVGAAGGQAISVEFPAEAPPDAGDDHPALDAVERALAGDPALRTVPVALTVPTAHRTVLEAVRQVPPGERATLEQVAHMSGLDPTDEDDGATLRAALRENPVPLLVPDHRVEGEWATPPDVAAALREAEGER